MIGLPALQSFIDQAQAVFAAKPYRDIRFPSLHNNGSPFNVPAVWTLDEARPRWDNLGVIFGEIEPQVHHDLTFWREVNDTFAPGLTILPNNGAYLFLIKQGQRETVSQNVSRSELPHTLSAHRDALFARGKLAALRGRQWSFADLDTIGDKDAIQFQHRGNLNEALQRALVGAFTAQYHASATENTSNQHAAVVKVAIAYLAARILADKGFFAPSFPSMNGSNQLPARDVINDPQRLLELTVKHTNGFFQHIYKDYLYMLPDDVLQQFAAHLGDAVTFALIDDRDVGSLYEQSILALHNLNESKKWKSNVPATFTVQIPNLQQHYTPMVIAERMLAALPLERLRPEERVIFDPAAGSGTLLLAATKRLAATPDIQLLHADERRMLLAHHVMGNDTDPNAALITQLRYALVQETLNKTFSSPEHFTTQDYEDDTAWPSSPRPRVLVANPPFQEKAAEQHAVTFLNTSLQHLQTGDQFAFVLPQSFLQATTHGWSQVRTSLAERARILETWQFPEGIVGLKARQSTCVVVGMVDSRTSYTIARAIISGAKPDIIREKGFLGQAWIGNISSGQWESATAPVPRITIPTIPLRQLFSVYVGVTRRKGIVPISYPNGDVPTKHYWQHIWWKQGKFIADPAAIPSDKRYIRYSKEFLERHRPENEAVYEQPKVLVSKRTNRGSRDPMPSYIDLVGLCHDNNVISLLPKPAQDVVHAKNIFDITAWSTLSDNEKLLWLLGILKSELAIDVMMPKRDSRSLSQASMLSFPLPTTIDRTIIAIVAEIIEMQKHDATDDDIAPLRKRLNELVEASYGHPVVPLTLTRTGKLPDMDAWQRERHEPPMAVTGMVLDVDAAKNQILLYLEGLLDDETEAWVPLPPELPGWALDGTVFMADLSESVETFADLCERPWALRHVQHTPRPYLSLSDLQEKLSERM